MRKLLGAVSRILGSLTGGVGVILLITITILIFFEVISRYIFRQPYGFMDEVSKWSMVWFVFLMIGVVEKRRGHIAIDLLLKKLPQRYKTGLLMVIDIVNLIFGIVLCWSGVEFIQLLIRIGITPGTEIVVPMWIVRLCVPLGGIILIFFSIEHLAADILSLSKYRR